LTWGIIPVEHPHIISYHYTICYCYVTVYFFGVEVSGIKRRLSYEPNVSTRFDEVGTNQPGIGEVVGSICCGPTTFIIPRIPIGTVLGNLWAGHWSRAPAGTSVEGQMDGQILRRV
jgi:hypothetical protein